MADEKKTGADRGASKGDAPVPPSEKDPKEAPKGVNPLADADKAVAAKRKQALDDAEKQKAREEKSRRHREDALRERFPKRKLPPGWSQCVGVRTCLIGGVARFKGDVFRTQTDIAKRFEKRGDLEIVESA